MTYYPTSVCVAIEGIGDDTTKSDGLAWTFTRLPAYPSNREFVGGLTRIPQTVDTSVNPYTGDLQTSTMSFEIAASDLAATKLMYVQTRAPYATTLSFGSSTTAVRINNNALAGEVVWIDDEAILLGSLLATNTYTGCTRGFWGTIATGHGLGVQVYTKPNYLRYRRVTVFTVDHTTGTESVRWRGFIDDIETDDTGKTITVSCLELWAAVAGAEVNKGAPRVAVTGHVVDSEAWQRPVFLGSVVADRRTLKDDGGLQVWYQLGDTMTLASYSTSTQRVTFDGPAAYWMGAPEFEYDSSKAELASISGGKQTMAQTYSDTAYELLVIDQRGSSVTGDLDYPFHPVAIAMAMLISGSGTTTSGYDVLGPEWGLAIDPTLFDTSAIDAIVASSPDLEIDRLILGWDGEPVRVMDTIINTLLRPYGFFPTITQAGLLSFARLEPVAIDIGTASQSTPLTPVPTALKWRNAREGQFFQANAEVGKTPWRDPDKVIVQRDGSFRDASRRSLFSRNNETSYDFQTVSPSTDRTAVIQELISRVVSGKSAAPMVGVTVLDSNVTGITYDLGDVITLEAPDIQQAWWIDSSGIRVNLSSTNASFIGVIIGREFEIPRLRYSLTLLLLNWSGGELILWRASSAEVVSVATATLTVTQRAFHASADDTSFFAVGDEVSIWGYDGSIVDVGPYTVQSLTATTIVLNTAPTASAGNIVRLARANQYSNTAHVSGVTRPWAYFAINGGIASVGDPDVYG